MNNLRKKPTFNELINYLNNQPIIKYPNRKASQIINDMVMSNLLFNHDVIDDDTINNKIDMIDKQTQKDYALQNYDLFPNMYHKIDATSEYRPNIIQNRSDNINQTVRYMLKHIDTPYSSLNHSSKPSSPPDGSIHKPTPEPSEKQAPSENKEPTPASSRRSPTPPTPVSRQYVKIKNKKGDSENSSSSSSSLSSEEIILEPLDGILENHLSNNIHTPTESPPISIKSSPPISVKSSPPISVKSSPPISVKSSPPISVKSSRSSKSISS